MQLRSHVLDWIVHRRGVRRWRRTARDVMNMPYSDLRRERSRARKLRYLLNEVISVADNRLSLPMIGSNAFPKRHGTDWSWRPKL
jgi:hypothetical protein